MALDISWRRSLLLLRPPQITSHQRSSVNDRFCRCQRSSAPIATVSSSQRHFTSLGRRRGDGEPEASNLLVTSLLKLEALLISPFFQARQPFLNPSRRQITGQVCCFPLLHLAKTHVGLEAPSRRVPKVRLPMSQPHGTHHMISLRTQYKRP